MTSRRSFICRTGVATTRGSLAGNLRVQHHEQEPQVGCRRHAVWHSAPIGPWRDTGPGPSSPPSDGPVPPCWKWCRAACPGSLSAEPSGSS
jgi:hypothetical protein